MEKALLSSEKMDWRTPPELLNDVRKLGPIGLDPCSSSVENENIAEVNIGISEDGLQISWRNQGLVFVNCPYGKELPKWTRKCVREFEETEGSVADQLVLLVPARTDTQWFKNHLLYADKLCFLHGRLKFVGAPHSAPFPSVLGYWGNKIRLFEDIFAGKGWFR